MDTTLRNRYGYCVIPRNSLLYRIERESPASDQIFFCTKYCEALAWGTIVQIWKTRKPIEVAFLVHSINHDAKGDSAVPDLYYQTLPDERPGLSDVGIKNNVSRRDSFARKLFLKYSMLGWFTSTENGSTGFEICLFNRTRIYRDVELIATVENLENEYYEDTIKRMKFYPPPSFYEISKARIAKSLSLDRQGKNPYREHMKAVNAWIDDYMKQGYSRENSKGYHYDLRQKLKI